MVHFNMEGKKNTFVKKNLQGANPHYSGTKPLLLFPARAGIKIITTRKTYV